MRSNMFTKGDMERMKNAPYISQPAGGESQAGRGSGGRMPGLSMA